MARFYFRKNKRFRKNKPKQSGTVDDLSRDIGTFSPGLVLGSKSILPLTTYVYRPYKGRVEAVWWPYSGLIVALL